MFNADDFNILDNIKLIENYKAFLLSSVADLYASMAKGNKTSTDEIIDELSEIVILSYMLGRRLGINFSQIDDKIIKKLKLGLLKEDESDTQYQDCAKLIQYIKEGREV